MLLRFGKTTPEQNNGYINNSGTVPNDSIILDSTYFVYLQWEALT